MIIGDPNTSRLNEKIIELEKRLKREINPTIYSWKEYMAKKGAESGFMLDLLENPKIMLIGREDDLWGFKRKSFIRIEEAERRYQEYKQGKVQAIPANKVFQDVRSKLK